MSVLLRDGQRAQSQPAEVGKLTDRELRSLNSHVSAIVESSARVPVAFWVSDTGYIGEETSKPSQQRTGDLRFRIP